MVSLFNELVRRKHSLFGSLLTWSAASTGTPTFF